RDARRQRDRLALRVLGEALRAELAPDPGRLAAAEGQREVERVAVHAEGPDADPRADRDAALDVRGEDRAGEPVGRVVRDRDRLLLVAVGEHAEHGAEDLLARDAHRALDAAKDRGLDEVPAREPRRAPPAADELGAVG